MKIKPFFGWATLVAMSFFTTQLASANESCVVSGQFDALDRHISNTNGAVLSESPSGQPFGHISCPVDEDTAVYAWTWAQLTPSAEVFDADEGGEFDLAFGVKQLLGNDWYIDAAIVWFNLAPFFDGNTDSIQPAIAFRRGYAVTDRWSLTPYVKAEYAVPIKGSTSGALLYAGLNTVYQHNDFAIYGYGHVLHDTEVTAGSADEVGHAQLYLGFPVGSVEIGPFTEVTAPIGSNNGRKTEYAVGLRTRFSF